MSNNIEKLIFGYLAILLFKSVISQPTREELRCKVFVEGDILQATCKDLKIERMPQHLETKIKKVHLSNSTLSKLEESQFERYKELEILKITGMRQNLDTNYYYVFRQLKKLKELDLSYGEWSFEMFQDSTFYWPPTLKTLTLTALSDTQRCFFDFSNLKQLEYLDVSQNNISHFPIFNKLAPLKHLNLNRTNLIRMTAEDLAPLCYLKEFHASLFVESEVLTPEKYCECKRVQSWIEKFKIKGTLSECTSRDEICDLNFSEDILSTRDKCLSRNKKTYVFIILILLLIVLLMIAAGAGGYFYWKKKIEVLEKPDNEVNTAG